MRENLILSGFIVQTLYMSVADAEPDPYHQQGSQHSGAKT